MPYKIRKLRSKNEYIVKNSKTKELISHHNSLDEAHKKIRLLDKLEFKERLKNVKFPINPFLE
jgi:hypothetical protein